jgi:hypothetical protein
VPALDVALGHRTEVDDFGVRVPSATVRSVSLFCLNLPAVFITRKAGLAISDPEP